jgi:RHS repeat-associated protein
MLGSTIALADGSGSVQTSYTYEPFGVASTTGMSSSNSGQFTGRENDGAGLYYYRARYYHPTIQRFLVEDPEEFGGGDVNLHSYVWNSPTNYIDPTGRVGFLVIPMAGCIGGAGGVILTTRKPTWGGVAAGCAVGAGIGVGVAFAYSGAAAAATGVSAAAAGGNSQGVRDTAQAIKDWLGPGAQAFRNKAGDLITMSRDGLRKVRFDINNPSPHANPHTHVEVLQNGEWVGTRIFPPGVTPH